MKGRIIEFQGFLPTPARFSDVLLVEPEVGLELVDGGGVGLDADPRMSKSARYSRPSSRARAPWSSRVKQAAKLVAM